ncbi:putative ABC transporter permease [Bacillaceae bacterium Marseille-Q3522]|nr:putative ABC transporter permease [Bacillaceae bacterium Marseille-Q3522]
MICLLFHFTFLSFALNMDGAAAVLFYFSIYAFFGWLLENFYSYFTTNVFYKENFFLGPFKPMYGFAPVLLVLFIRQDTPRPVLFLSCFLIPTFVEYLSGVLLQKFTGKQWWDYSHLPIQLHGHICLPFSLCWIFLSIICIKWLHPAVSSLYDTFSEIWLFVWPIVLLYFLWELFFAIRRHVPESHMQLG